VLTYVSAERGWRAGAARPRPFKGAKYFLRSKKYLARLNGQSSLINRYAVYVCVSLWMKLGLRWGSDLDVICMIVERGFKFVTLKVILCSYIFFESFILPRKKEDDFILKVIFFFVPSILRCRTNSKSL
jgi:hypothetical protein